MRKFIIKTLGCPKNEYDSSILAYFLKKKGLIEVENILDATDVIINTCAFITEAKIQSLETIFEILELKKEKADLKVYIYGCLAQRYFKQLLNQIPEVDGIIGLCDLHEITKAIANQSGKIKLFCEHPQVICNEFQGRILGNEPFAYVKIGDGCNRNCTFCSIPFFKGKHVSREMKDILEEVRVLIENGKKEIILVDQDITQFKDSKGNGFIELLKSIDEIDGDFWVRTMYIHPDHIDAHIIREMSKLKKWLHYLDVPIQHGSNDILKSMGRIKNKGELISFFKMVRSEIPDVILRSSFIIGFPGETERDFEELLDIIEKIKFERFGFFAYSSEEGTAAHEFKEKIDKTTLKRRLEIANDFASVFLENIQAQNIGKKLKVLVEGFDNESQQFYGRSYMDAPEVDTYIYIEGNDHEISIGDWVNVEITDLTGLDLEGRIVVNESSKPKTANNTCN